MVPHLLNSDFTVKELLAIPVPQLTNNQLSDICIFLNNEYRQGNELVSDEVFDFDYMNALKKRCPNHELIIKPQPTTALSTGLIPHTCDMLSTDKAYTIDDIERYVSLCEKHATLNSIDPSTLMYRITPKLDGIAANLRKSENLLLTRGDDGFGEDFSSLLNKGLNIIGDLPSDSIVGEVVVLRDYFDQNIKGEYKNPRNYMSGVVSRIIRSNSTTKITDKALSDKAIHFVVFDSVEGVTVDKDALFHSLEDIALDMKNDSPYLTDGTVIEVTNNQLQKAMGHNNSFHLWQIAKKVVGETANSPIIEINYTVGRSGAVTPTAHIEPRELSGVTVSNVLLHHAGRVRDERLGAGAVIQLTRSGEVIPKFIKTIEGTTPVVPTNCPCCDSLLEWEGDTLFCKATYCSAAVSNNLIHHFKRIGVKGWADKTMEKLVSAGHDTLEKLYNLSHDDLVSAGVGSGTASNLLKERERGLSAELKDSNLLASLGIKNLGRGTSKKILSVCKISDIHTLSPSDLKSLPDFGDITSVGITNGLLSNKSTLDFLLSKQFNLLHTSDVEVVEGGSLSGMVVVFSGKMNADRKEMERVAVEEKGAKATSSSVNSKTDLLVMGQKVGQKKLDGAAKHNVRMITEKEYFDMF
jgi:DNA ligase (NAD+)